MLRRLHANGGTALCANVSDDGRTVYWAQTPRAAAFNAIATALWYQDCAAARASSWLAGTVLMCGPADEQHSLIAVPRDRLDALAALTRGPRTR